MNRPVRASADHPPPHPHSVETLDTIWVSVLDLCEEHFSQDLDPSVLRDPSCWAALRAADHLRQQAVRLPLPRSNSPAAKQVRIAAVLAALSRSLARHVFRPAWAADNIGAGTDAALGTLLRGLEAASPDHERYLRGALLAAAAAVQARDARGASNTRRAAAAVVREVTFLVQHLLSALQYEAFRAGLEACVALACERWAELQGAAMRIEPYFGPPYDDFDWQVLMLPERFGEGLDAGSGATKGSPRGSPTAAAAQVHEVVSTSPPPPSSTARDNDDDASTVAESVRSVVDPADIMMVLWPTMCAVEGGELVSITQGLVMSKEQAAAAFEEEGRRRRRPLTNGKRARSMSQSRGGAARSPHSAKAALVQAKRERDASSVSASGSRDGSRDGSLTAVD